MRGAALVLAAGRSRRMGKPKADLPLGDQSFLETILSRLPADLWVSVVGAGGIPNPHPEKGQLYSLQLGLQAGAAQFPFTLVALVDLPAVSARTYALLVEAASRGGADLWVPRYAGRRGHPVVFGQACYEDLLRAPLEQGSRWVVGRHRERRVEIEVDDPEIHRDVDTPADYRRLLEEQGHG